MQIASDDYIPKRFFGALQVTLRGLDVTTPQCKRFFVCLYSEKSSGTLGEKPQWLFQYSGPFYGKPNDSISTRTLYNIHTLPPGNYRVRAMLDVCPPYHPVIYDKFKNPSEETFIPSPGDYISSVTVPLRVEEGKTTAVELWCNQMIPETTGTLTVPPTP